MKKAIALCLIAILLNSCHGATPTIVEQTPTQHRADEVVKSLLYFKDTRTGVCFVYYWGGAGNGGPALASVPCAVVPADMLISSVVVDHTVTLNY